MNEAGQLIEPWVSDPKAMGLKPAARDTAEPPEDPHGCLKWPAPISEQAYDQPGLNPTIVG